MCMEKNKERERVGVREEGNLFNGMSIFLFLLLSLSKKQMFWFCIVNNFKSLVKSQAFIVCAS